MKPRYHVILTDEQVAYIGNLIKESTNGLADTDAMDRETSLALQEAQPLPDGKYRLFRVPNTAAQPVSPRIMQAGELLDVTGRYDELNRQGAKSDEGYAFVILDPVGLPIAAA